MNNMNRIIFTGAQGTGKTTVLKALEERGANVITEVVRNLSKKGVKINEDGDENGQKKIFKAYEKLLSENTSYISDRGLVDVLAYTMYLSEKGLVSEELVTKQFKALAKFMKSNGDIIYCYFPIEFAVVDDGTRSVNEDFRAAIDENIKTILAKMGVTYVTVRGSQEERIAILDKLQTWLKYGVELYAESFVNNSNYSSK
jgi:predicted ATPase